MNRLTTALVALTILVLPTLAWAQTDVTPHFDNGSRLVRAKVDALGIQRVTEEYPSQLQNDAFPLSIRCPLDEGAGLRLGRSRAPRS